MAESLLLTDGATAILFAYSLLQKNTYVMGICLHLVEVIVVSLCFFTELTFVCSEER